MSSLFKKCLALTALSAVLSLLLGLVGNLSAERAGRRDAVTREIAESSAGAQVILGPALALDLEGPVDPAGHRSEDVIVLYPRDLEIDAVIAVERRHRGIFDVPVFSTKQHLKGAFDAAPIPKDATLRRARLLVGLGDTRGLTQAPTLRYAGAPLAFEAGTEEAGKEGIHAEVPLAAVSSGARFEIDLDLGGTHDVAWAPVAGSATVHVSSTWPHPSFTGAALPAERSVGAGGFEATWRTNPFQSGASLKTTLPALRAGILDMHARPFGVGFPAPGDAYAQVDRAVKYGFLFVLLTFGVFAVYESTRRLAIHPVQYGMVGIALVLFFLVLLSLAEHFSFSTSYAAATTGSLVLLVYYLRHVLGHWQRGAAFGGMFATLYGTLFVLLRLEEYALVAGAGLLFALLAIAMVVTRHVDWYRVGEPPPAHAPPEHPFREYGPPSRA